VFGMKLHWQQVEQMRADLGLGGAARAHGAATVPADDARDAVPRPALCARAAGGHRPPGGLVLDRRADRGSGACTAGRNRASARPPDYDRAAIAGWRRTIEHGDAAWDRYFRDNQIEPVRVTYEELADDYERVVARVATALGAPHEADDVPPARLRRQADERSELVLDRYRGERDPSAPS